MGLWRRERDERDTSGHFLMCLEAPPNQPFSIFCEPSGLEMTVESGRPLTVAFPPATATPVITWHADGLEIDARGDSWPVILTGQQLDWL